MTTIVLNSKISEVENKIPNMSSLVTTTALNTKINKVENKILNHDKYITTPEFNKLTAEIFAATLRQCDLVNIFGNKLTSFNKRISLNKKKNI